MGQDDGDNVKAARAIFYVVGGEEVTGAADESDFLGGRDGVFGRSKGGIGFGPDLDEDYGAIGIDHDQVDFAGLAGKVAGEGFEAFAPEETLAAFFTPSAETLAVGQ